MIYFICIIHLHIFHGNIWTQNWPAPNVSGFIAQLVERRTGIARSRVQAPLKSWIFFRLLYAVAKIAIITARIILHLISYPQFTYDLFHMHHSPSYLSREHMNPKLTSSQRQWLHSSVGRASHRYRREVTGSSPVEVLNFFQASLRSCKNCDHNCEDHSSLDFISAVHIWFISYASFTSTHLLININKKLAKHVTLLSMCTLIWLDALVISKNALILIAHVLKILIGDCYSLYLSLLNPEQLQSSCLKSTRPVSLANRCAEFFIHAPRQFLINYKKEAFFRVYPGYHRKYSNGIFQKSTHMEVNVFVHKIV